MQKSVSIGDIFCSSWGYDQTNVDFYQVVDVMNSFAKLRPIKSKYASGDGWTGSVIPVKDDFSGDSFRKKIQDSGTGDVGFRISSFEWARRWDVQPQSYTAYA
jgi:hypothetical protein